MFKSSLLITQIIMVKDAAGKPRGYAFIEFEHERDMHREYILQIQLFGGTLAAPEIFQRLFSRESYPEVSIPFPNTNWSVCRACNDDSRPFLTNLINYKSFVAKCCVA